MSTVDVMADPPFGFSSGDDSPKEEPGRDKHGKNDPDSGSSPSDPLAAFGISGDFGMGDLGQIFTQLGQMFSSAGSAVAPSSQVSARCTASAIAACVVGGIGATNPIEFVATRLARS